MGIVIFFKFVLHGGAGVVTSLSETLATKRWFMACSKARYLRFSL